MTFEYDPNRLLTVVVPHPRSDAVAYLTDEQLPGSGTTDVQTGAVEVPAWATSAMIFVEYELSDDPLASGEGYASARVYVGPSVGGTLVKLANVESFGTGGTPTRSIAAVARDIGGAATIGVACLEEQDPAYPGKVTVHIVFH
jgi:hypothetical protein